MSDVLAVLPCLLLVAAPARAEHAGYEGRVVASALARNGLTRASAPEGKRIESVRIFSSPVVTEADLWPDWLDLFHVTTRKRVIRRVLLLHPGETYRATRAAESERNLRALAIFSVARVVAARGANGGVVLVVVTKDLWSLRLNMAYSLVGSLLQTLQLEPSERNFLGFDNHVGLDFLLQQDTLALGEAFSDSRLLGRELSLAEQAVLIFNRHTRAPEGSAGALSFGRPLYSLEQRWGFDLAASWNVSPTRIFRGASVWKLPYPSAGSPTAFVPYVYDAREFDAEADATRSFGTATKANLTFGLGGYSHRYAPSAPGLTSAERAWLVSEHLPRSEDAVYLALQLETFQPRWMVLHGFERFAVAEDYQLGWHALLEARWADPVFLSATRWVELGASLRWRAYHWDDLLTAEAAGAVRWMPAVASQTGTPFVNRRGAAQVENISPILGIGRLVVRGLVDFEAKDLSHPVRFVGGTEGPRGFPPEVQGGRNAILWNVEYRTRPWVFHGIRTGLVVFYDGGSAFDATPEVLHAVGVGLRIMLPRINLTPIRIDFGFALNGPRPSWLERFSSSFGQVTDIHPAFLDQPLG